MLIERQKQSSHNIEIETLIYLRRALDSPMFRAAGLKYFVSLICVVSLTMTLSNVCGAALPAVEVAKTRDIAISPFSLGCASSSVGACPIDLSELPAGEVHITHISGFSEDADANVIPVFSDGSALFHVLPWQSYSQDTGNGLDVLYSQAVDLVWEADSILIGEPGASSVVARVFGHVVLDSSVSATARPTDYSSVPEPSSATLLAGLTFLLPLHRRRRRLTGA